MKKKSFGRTSYVNIFTMLFCVTLFMASCTKYAANTTSSTTSTGSGGGTGPNPLPPYYGGGGTGSGSGGSGSSGGSGGSGTGTVDPNIPQSHVQCFNFTGTNYSYITVSSDSLSAKADGYYTDVYAGQNTLKYKIGSGAASDPTSIYGYYFLKPYTYYSWITYKTPQYSIAETMLYNDLTTPTSGSTQIRFISLDPLTTTVPIKFRVTNYADDYWTLGRTYLDHKDTTIGTFLPFTPGQSTVTFYYRDSAIFKFNKIFDAGKKYTVYAQALSYITNSKGQFPVSTYNITQHN
jgi:hypothetical protein